MSVIAVEKLTKRYGVRVGIEQVSFAVPPGVVFGFLGPNGARKTTTIRVLVGLLHPTAGRARVFGLDTWDQSPRIKADVGYLPGDLRLYPWFTGHKALTIVGAIRGQNLGEPGRELADYFALDLDVRVREMSRGMRQKLGLILALAHRPKLLILDEPTSGLDPLMQDRLRLHLRNLASQGHTVFFSSHTLSEVEDVCDRVAIVREGHLVADESLDTLKARAKREVTIRWRDHAAVSDLAAPAFLEVDDRRDAEWHCTLSGAAPELVGWLADKPVADLTIGRPDLDTLFRRYYEREADQG